ncbi:MAG TPA: aldo/keto reductase [Terracidiphilus sp.]|jgi:pyridoxine 4-dehydrogenase|nr:aldo/keto reductase [Terracidiphilus sp.]
MPADTATLPAAQAGTVNLGDLTVHRMGYGAMRITGPGIWGPPADRDAAMATLRRAVELGVNLIDTADSYGPEVSEELIAEALAPYPAGLVITTKVGWTRHGAGVWQHNASPTHIAQAIEASLRRLRLERIDVYQLHVPDPATSFDASVEAIARLREQGKVRHVGLSNVTLEHIQRAQKIVPIVSVQNRYSFSDREWDYVVDYCQANGIAFMPWGPIAQGRKANEVVEKIATARGTSTAVVSLAWLLRRASVMLVIPGTSSVKHVEENISAAAFRLTDQEFADLNAVLPKPYWLRA